LILGGVGTIAVVALWARLFPTLRRADRLTAQTPADTAEEAAGLAVE
jgi:hypothetical protein